MCFDIIPVDGEQVNPLIGSLVKPREMVDTQYIYKDVTTVDLCQTQLFIADARQPLLGNEYINAAADGIDTGVHMI